MSEVASPAERCLNCAAPLSGPFCASCGQRAVPPNPTVADLTHDAWEELSGYDGRILATARGLLRPGQLTRDYIAGRRAHYLPPIRVYLTVSVMYFVVAAATPVTLGEGNGREFRSPGVQIEVTGTDSQGALTEEDRIRLRSDLAEVPGVLRPMLYALVEDPAGFRSRVFTTMPRVSFAMLPVFAAIVALFYRRRPFPTALVFAVHLHCFAFAVLTVAELMKFTGSAYAAVGAGALAMASLVAYVLVASRRVYGGAWLTIIAKTAAIGLIYALASVPAFAIILAWATLAR